MSRWILWITPLAVVLGSAPALGATPVGQRSVQSAVKRSFERNDGNVLPSVHCWRARPGVWSCVAFVGYEDGTFSCKVSAVTRGRHISVGRARCVSVN